MEYMTFQRKYFDNNSGIIHFVVHVFTYVKDLRESQTRRSLCSTVWGLYIFL